MGRKNERVNPNYDIDCKYSNCELFITKTILTYYITYKGCKLYIVYIKRIL